MTHQRTRCQRGRGARGLALGAGTLMMGAGLFACSTIATGSAGAATATSHKQTISLEPSSGPAGTLVHIVGQGYAPGEQVQLAWQKITGSWDVTTTATGKFLGAAYRPSFVPFTAATIGSTGSLSSSLRVPAGFGFTHEITVSHAGKTLSDAEFKVSMTASISPKKGPVGTPIHITLTGVGYTQYYEDWQLLYDNHQTGWISAVTTEGTANFTIPATGIVGVHELAIYEATREPYLNEQQSPPSYQTPIFHLSFTVTKGSPVLPSSAAVQTAAAVPADPVVHPSSGPTVSLNDMSGPPGTPLELTATGFPADAAVTVSWATRKGSHLTGLKTTSKTLARAETSSKGSLDLKFAAPSTLGEAHTITVTTGAVSATTTFSITPKALSIEPSRGPVGTTITVQLVGTGVTWTSNTYALDYDNSDIGYACGVNTGGDVIIHLLATGTPGWHFIYLYPQIWNVVTSAFAQTEDVQVSQLTYAADHPGEHLSAYEFAFYVTS
jgi:hypothetical protein